MCGIFGLLQTQPILGSELTKMSELLRHRGPDDEGILVSGFKGSDARFLFGGRDTPENVLHSRLKYTPSSRIQTGWVHAPGGIALGHRRLSILDLSPAGHQPMSYRERYWLIFNGEIYNYIEIRAELVALGHAFASGTDSEVILAAYAEWGPACLNRFNGMFAFAVFDSMERKLFLARDRFGVKPLYFYVSPNQLAFASEIKAFCGLSSWRAKANIDRLLDFIVWNTSDHTSETFFENVQQLPPGHFAILSLDSVRESRDRPPALVPTRWYSLRDAIRPNSDAGVQEFRELLADSVRLRLRADVPVGSCLSGGLDSSSIVCLAAQQLKNVGSGQLNTFTAGSKDAAFDETRYAQSVIDRASANANYITPEPARFLEEFGDLIWHQDEPFPTSSIYAQWCVFRKAKERGATVMLDGQGADESLGGYRGFFGAYLAGIFRAGHLLTWRNEMRSMKREIGFSGLRSLGYTAAYAFPNSLRLLGRFEKRSYSDAGWLGRDYHSAIRSDPIQAAGGRATSVREMSIAQLTATNLPMLLHWEDRNSMAFSIEARVPFLDYRLVEFCINLPDEAKLSGGVSKRVLREAMRGTVPDTVLDRRDKMGFVTAEPLWMKRDLAREFRQKLQTSAELLKPIVTNTILNRYDTMVAGGKFDHRYLRVMAAGVWLDRFSVTLT